MSPAQRSVIMDALVLASAHAEAARLRETREGRFVVARDWMKRRDDFAELRRELEREPREVA